MTRGILSTCHVRPTRPITQAELDALYADAYADEPFVTVVADAAGHQARHRQQPRPRPRPARRADRPDPRDRRRGQPRQGRRRPGVQAFNLVHGLPETAGLEQLPLAP